jgi:ABC-type uncharacterized transport system involved in gliding motility auxiliary subunit
MPLTTRKLTHISAMYQKIFASRSQQVVLTMRTSIGGTTTLQIKSVFRVMGDMDPTLSQTAADVETRATTPDVIAEFLETDVTLPQLRSVIYLTLAAGVGAQPAQKYTIAAIDVRGMAPGGDRFLCHCMRQH